MSSNIDPTGGDREFQEAVEALFESVRELPPEERERAIDSAAVADEVRREVRSLLRYDRASAPTVGGRGSQIDPQSLIGASADGFTIRRPLGAGGMGFVFEAEQNLPTRRVALKVLHGSISRPALLARFRRESDFLARLDHPNIARVIAAGTIRLGDGAEHPYFAMELVDGGRPINRWASETRADRREVARVFAEACDAVGHGHRRGVVHLDLKPGNLLVSAAGQARVIDYGIARSIGDGASETSFVGTPQYMAPEQFVRHGQEPDSRSDVYSLGLVLYELVAGRLPYAMRGASAAEAARIVAGAEIADPARVDATVPSGLAAIVMKCLARERDARYGTAAEIADDLRRWLADEPILARPERTIETLARVVRRNRRATALGAAALVAVVVSAVIAIAAARGAREAAAGERAEASRANQRAAAAAARAGDVVNAASLLQRVDPSKRGWEWRHLTASLARAELLAPTGAEVLLAVRIDSTNEVAAAVTGGHLMVVDPSKPDRWEHHDLRAEYTGPNPHFRALDASSDGAVLYAVLNEGSLLAVDRAARRTRTLLPANWCACVGELLVVLDDLGLFLLDPKSGEKVGSRLPLDGTRVLDLGLSADRRSLLVASIGGVLAMVEVDATARTLAQRWRTEPRAISSRAVALSSDGAFGIVAWRDGGVSRIRGEDGSTALERDLPGGSVYDLAISPDDRRAVDSSWSGLLRVIDVETLEIVDRLGYSLDHVWGIAFDRTGTRVYGHCAAASPGRPADRHMVPWLAAYDLGPTAAARDFAIGGAVAVAACSPDGERFIAACADGLLREVHPRTGSVRELARVETPVRSVCNDRESLLAGFDDGTVARFDPSADGSHALRWRTPVFAGEACALAWSPDGRSVACGGAPFTGAMLDAETGSIRWKRDLPIGESKPDRRRVRWPLFLDDGASVTFFCLASMASQPIHRVTDGASVGIYGSVTTECEQYARVGGTDLVAGAGTTGSISIHRRDAPLTYHPAARNGGAIASSPDGTRIVVAARDGACRVLDAGSMQEILLLDLPAGFPMAVAVDAGADEVSVLTSRGTVRTWSGRIPAAALARPVLGPAETALPLAP